ncbi:TetR/AcrR family transcriptional regulator [Streptococcus sp. CSL10205-OR2]|uniref:TetR/AcrR family transcriptional regulator n=1 Tax=Streptococcus sp. CSL10205-OR2 TaxID=2980558 RepID=UPI0021DA320E|nr:TetR/AcrR family transcriptional regulator [Streptococcus sp. CSL10205-OR2]MCU9533681.1 TetR/AcrR family transcriptional regulator [Streptococcus sp. CSL10205-OR2]
MRNKEKTIENILESAREEFTKHGFEKASIRVIAKNAGVTPGAIYKHFDSKETIFKAIVSPVLDQFYKKTQELTQRALEAIQLDDFSGFQEIATKDNKDLLDDIYQNFAIFNLLFNASQGTHYDSIQHEIVNFEVAEAKKIMSALREKKIPIKPFNDRELHILYTMVLTPLFEIITHQYPYEDALLLLDLMDTALRFGWDQLIKPYLEKANSNEF